VRTFFLYCQTGRNLYNWQHSKADWGGRWTCVLFDPKTKGLNPLWQWILLFLGHPQWVILFSSWVVFEYFGSNPASDPQTKTLVLHLVSDTVSDNENHSHLLPTGKLSTDLSTAYCWPECCNTMVLGCQISVFCV
jgi:hypothetical protein